MNGPVNAIRAGLRGLLALLMLLRQRWYIWTAAGLLGALLYALPVLFTPPLWVSEGEVILYPRIQNEGHFMSIHELANHYALRLREEQRIARVAASVGMETPPDRVMARISTDTLPESGVVRLRVLHQDPATAETFTRALMIDFRDELEGENRTRNWLQRLNVNLSPSSFPEPASRSWQSAARRGFAVGAGVALLLLLLWTLWVRNRIATPLEAEQLTGAPTLGAIPRRSLFRR